MALGRALQQLLLASYGLYPDDLENEVRAASVHLGGEDVVLLLADYDQRFLVGFEQDDRTFSIDGPGPGLAFRHEVAVEEPLEWTASAPLGAGEGLGGTARSPRCRR